VAASLNPFAKSTPEPLRFKGCKLTPSTPPHITGGLMKGMQQSPSTTALAPLAKRDMPLGPDVGYKSPSPHRQSAPDGSLSPVQAGSEAPVPNVSSSAITTPITPVLPADSQLPPRESDGGLRTQQDSTSAPVDAVSSGISGSPETATAEAPSLSKSIPTMVQAKSPRSPNLPDAPLAPRPSVGAAFFLAHDLEEARGLTEPVTASGLQPQLAAGLGSTPIAFGSYMHVPVEMAKGQREPIGFGGPRIPATDKPQMLQSHLIDSLSLARVMPPPGAHGNVSSCLPHVGSQGTAMHSPEVQAVNDSTMTIIDAPRRFGGIEVEEQPAEPVSITAPRVKRSSCCVIM
jgi:hypothetical protein